MKAPETPHDDMTADAPETVSVFAIMAFFFPYAYTRSLNLYHT